MRYYTAGGSKQRVMVLKHSIFEGNFVTRGHGFSKRTKLDSGVTDSLLATASQSLYYSDDVFATYRNSVFLMPLFSCYHQITCTCRIKRLGAKTDTLTPGKGSLMYFNVFADCIIV